MEGYKYALVITDCCTGYRWLYGLKTKDEVLMAVKKWYSDIAELRDMHKIYVVTRDISGENSSKEIREFLESKGIQNYFSIPVRAMAEWPTVIIHQFSHETWQISDGRIRVGWPILVPCHDGG